MNTLSITELLIIACISVPKNTISSNFPIKYLHNNHISRYLHYLWIINDTSWQQYYLDTVWGCKCLHARIRLRVRIKMDTFLFSSFNYFFLLLSTNGRNPTTRNGLYRVALFFVYVCFNLLSSLPLIWLNSFSPIPLFPLTTKNVLSEGAPIGNVYFCFTCSVKVFCVGIYFISSVFGHFLF